GERPHRPLAQRVSRLHRGGPRVARTQPRHRGRRVRLIGRAFRLRQVHRPQDHRGAGNADLRPHPLRRAGHHWAGAARPQHRHGVPELRPLPAHDGAAEPGVRPPQAPRPQAGARPEGGRDRRHVADRRHVRTEAAAALRRAAAARRARPGADPRPGGLPAGRAAVEPGREAARPHAGGTGGAAPEGADHHGLRHPRPTGGADALRPHRRDEPRRDAAGGPAGGDLFSPRQPLRRRVHRHPLHEHDRGRSQHRGRQAGLQRPRRRRRAARGAAPHAERRPGDARRPAGGHRPGRAGRARRHPGAGDRLRTRRAGALPFRFHGRWLRHRPHAGLDRAAPGGGGLARIAARPPAPLPGHRRGRRGAAL
ncbi:MAG: Glycerol-3-phosphate ABC transporter, ATP-binding protein UgpC, partial [uncultured Acetobacteraceae bacterium]